MIYIYTTSRSFILGNACIYVGYLSEKISGQFPKRPYSRCTIIGQRKSNKKSLGCLEEERRNGADICSYPLKWGSIYYLRTTWRCVLPLKRDAVFTKNNLSASNVRIPTFSPSSLSLFISLRLNTLFGVVGNRSSLISTRRRLYRVVYIFFFYF